MAIGSAVQEDDFVVVYDERGNRLFGKRGTLSGYTSGNVSVREGDYVVTYDERGNRLFGKPTF